MATKKKEFDINTFIFGRTKAENKLTKIKDLSGEEIRKTTQATIMKITKACMDDNNTFRINMDRRVGNDWNSTIENLYVMKDKLYISLYVQTSSTDSSMSETYSKFVSGNEYNGYCSILSKSFKYSYNDVTEVIRCILLEYIYYKYIEKDERERKAEVDKLMHYTIVNPVYNHFFRVWQMKYIHGLSKNSPIDWVYKQKGYYKAKEALESWIGDNYKELKGKSKEELIETYKGVFQKAYDDFKKGFDAYEYRKNLLF